MTAYVAMDCNYKMSGGGRFKFLDIDIGMRSTASANIGFAGFSLDAGATVQGSATLVVEGKGRTITASVVLGYEVSGTVNYSYNALNISDSGSIPFQECPELKREPRTS